MKTAHQRAQDVDDFPEQVTAIPGIGAWTANYIALKKLQHTDAFPAIDLILTWALEIHSLHAVARMSPWQGHVAALFWRGYSDMLTKSKRSKL